MDSVGHEGKEGLLGALKGSGDACFHCNLCVKSRFGAIKRHPCMEYFTLQPPRRRGALPKPFRHLSQYLKKPKKRVWKGGPKRPRIIKSQWGREALRALPKRESFKKPRKLVFHTKVPDRGASLVTTPCRVTSKNLSRHDFNPVETLLKTIPPEFSMEPQRALELTMEQQRRRLANAYNLALGGRKNIQGEPVGLPEGEGTEDRVGLPEGEE
jgi:hypothetical protein